MPTFLLSTIPLPVKLLATLILSISLVTFGFVKGSAYELNRVKADQLDAYEKALASAQRKALEDNRAAAHAAARREAAEKKAKDLRAQLNALIKERKVYQECFADDEVIDKINEALR